jgi:hypothetical protein
MAEPLSISACLYASGAVLLSCTVGAVLGDATGFGELSGAVIGSGFYLAFVHPRDINAGMVFVWFCCAVVMTLQVAQGIRAMVLVNTNLLIPREAMFFMNALVAFYFQPIALSAMKSVKTMRLSATFPFIRFKDDYKVGGTD